MDVWPQATLSKAFDPLRGVLRHNPMCRSMNAGFTHPPVTLPTEDQTDSDTRTTKLVLGIGSHGW